VMTTQMAGVVPVDRSGEPLSNILTWLDTRAAGHPRKLFAGAVRISGYSPLLLLKMLRVSGGAPGKLGKDPLPKYTWFAEEQAEVYARTWKFLDVKGYLLYKLTSRAVITVDEASITWLADTRNPHDVKWSDDLLRIFGVDREKLPEIVQPTDVVGELAPSAAKELNLASGTKVVAGCGDVPATAVGSGAVEDYEVHAYVGTGNWFAAHVPERVLDVVHYMGCILSAIPGRYLLVAEQQTGAVAIDYAAKLLKLKSPEEVGRTLEGRRPGESKLLFLPWLYGERSPVEDPALRGALLGISLDADEADVVSAVLEGIALNMSWEFHYFRRLLGRDLRRIWAVGGGALYDFLCSALANALEVEVVRGSWTREATLAGAFVVGMVAAGRGGFDIAKKVVREERVFRPDPALVEAFRRKRKLFLEAYRRLRGFYRDMLRAP